MNVSVFRWTKCIQESMQCFSWKKNNESMNLATLCQTSDTWLSRQALDETVS